MKIDPMLRFVSHTVGRWTDVRFNPCSVNGQCGWMVEFSYTPDHNGNYAYGAYFFDDQGNGYFYPFDIWLDQKDKVISVVSATGWLHAECAEDMYGGRRHPCDQWWTESYDQEENRGKSPDAWFQEWAASKGLITQNVNIKRREWGGD